MSNTNLPPEQLTDSAAGTKLFFDSYGRVPFEFNATEVDATIGFFQQYGFGKDASVVSALALLKQAKLDEIPVFQILDQLKSFEQIEITALVGEILNNNRKPSSTLGYRKESVSRLDQTRNIGA